MWLLGDDLVTDATGERTTCLGPPFPAVKGVCPGGAPATTTNMCMEKRPTGCTVPGKVDLSVAATHITRGPRDTATIYGDTTTAVSFFRGSVSLFRVFAVSFGLCRHHGLFIVVMWPIFGGIYRAIIWGRDVFYRGIVFLAVLGGDMWGGLYYEVFGIIGLGDFP